mmetsp:Transcript_32460/g.81335  ORF Transcript_32460/g.81335 Transcript_32460/m.81335 type:complete len:340 (-) Transcript_32460:309-1328(-)
MGFEYRLAQGATAVDVALFLHRGSRPLQQLARIHVDTLADQEDDSGTAALLDRWRRTPQWRWVGRIAHALTVQPLPCVDVLWLEFDCPPSVSEDFFPVPCVLLDVAPDMSLPPAQWPAFACDQALSLLAMDGVATLSPALAATLRLFRQKIPKYVVEGHVGVMLGRLDNQVELRALRVVLRWTNRGAAMPHALAVKEIKRFLSKVGYPHTESAMLQKALALARPSGLLPCRLGVSLDVIEAQGNQWIDDKVGIEYVLEEVEDFEEAMHALESAGCCAPEKCTALCCMHTAVLKEGVFRPDVNYNLSHVKLVVNPGKNGASTVPECKLYAGRTIPPYMVV